MPALECLPPRLLVKLVMTQNFGAERGIRAGFSIGPAQTLFPALTARGCQTAGLDHRPAPPPARHPGLEAPQLWPDE